MSKGYGKWWPFPAGPLRVRQVTAESEALTGLQVAYGRQLGFQHGTIEALQALGGISVLFGWLLYGV